MVNPILFDFVAVTRSDDANLQDRVQVFEKEACADKHLRPDVPVLRLDCATLTASNMRIRAINSGWWRYRERKVEELWVNLNVVYFIMLPLLLLLGFLTIPFKN